MTITVIDYKAGNLTSVMKALDALGCTAQVTADPDVVRRATQVILLGLDIFKRRSYSRTLGWLTSQ